MLKNTPIRILYLFLIIPTILFSQEKFKVIFNIKGELFAPFYNEAADTNKVNTLRANVVRGDIKYSVTLVDYNKNNTFNDYRGCCGKVGSDGIFITAHKEKISNIIYSHRAFITKDHPLAINNKTYILTNLRKTKNGFYQAEILEKDINPESIFKAQSTILLNKIPNVTLENFFTGKFVNLTTIKEKDEFLFLRVFNQRDFSIYINNQKSDKLLRKFSTKLKIVNVLVLKNKNLYDYLIKKYISKDKNVLTINRKESKKLLQIGYKSDPVGTYLFNKKGNLVFTDFDNAVANKNKEIMSKLQQ